MEDDKRIITPNTEDLKTLNRRDFVRILTTATIGAGAFAAAFKGFALSPSQRAEAAETMADRIGKLPKRQFCGRMKDVKTAPIIICQDWRPELYAAGLAAGLNMVHKAGYWKTMPPEFAKLPRESYYTDITVDSTPRNPDDEEGAYRQVNESLKQNGLKYYDVFKAHFGWRSVQSMKDQRGTYRAFQRLKKEGKVRYFGVSQHDYLPYPEIISAQIDDGVIDTIQMFFTYGAPQATVDVLEKARKAGIGVVAMKVMGGAVKMRADTAYQAQLKASGKVGRALYRHVLTLKGKDKKPIFAGCVTNVGNFDQFEENIGAGADKIARADGFFFDV
ncbi:MAG TPA: aldo/keto reductase [Armatimonadota bacterium]|jgi:hypothetical protein